MSQRPTQWTLENRTNQFFERLEAYYPEHVVFSLDAINKTLRERLNVLYKENGFQSDREFLNARGFSVGYAKDVRKSPICEPGHEPDIIKGMVSDVLIRAEATYPEKKITSSLTSHSNLYKDMSALAGYLGYQSTMDFLKAYGYKEGEYVGNAERPKTNNYDEIVEDLKTRYGGSNRFYFIDDIVKENPELRAPLKTLANIAKEKYGMSLKDYFRQEGILAGEPRQSDKSALLTSTIQVVNDQKSGDATSLSPVWKVRFAENILDRGQKYYDDGLVNNLFRSGETYESTVSGTKDYHVSMFIKNGKLISAQCDCPNAEEGYLCKHMAATLFAIEAGKYVSFSNELKQEYETVLKLLSKYYPEHRINYPVTNLPDLYRPLKLVSKSLGYPGTKEFCEAHGYFKNITNIRNKTEITAEEKNLIGASSAAEQKKINLAEIHSKYAAKSSPTTNAAPINNKKPVTRRDYIDPDFNTEILDKKVKYWQQQLLDHGKRNKMMHFRETARTTLNLTSPGFEELFSRIVVNDESLSFRRPIGINDDSRMYSLLQLAKALDPNVEFAVGDIETKGTYANTAAACGNLKNKAQLALDEQGTNILYLCFGFIEWRRKVTSGGEEWLKSPLVLVPVKITNESLISPYQLKRRDDDIVVNPTLSHLFEEQFRVKLPTLEANPKLSDIEKFMNEADELATSHGWRTSRECCIGLMSFLKITMYNDMVNNEDMIKKNPIIRAFAGENNSVNILDDVDLSFNHDRTSSMDSYQVMDADSSQQDAIGLSKQGVSFVLQGPPGTGKSQTITNIIAEGLADGKKILFVSEKLAALEVVYKRLREAQLDKFCLPLHNHKANKKDVIDEIGQNLQLNKVKTKSDDMVKLTQLDLMKEKLNHYIVDIHKPIQPLGMSLYEVYGAVAEQDDIPFVSTKIENITDISRSEYYQLLMQIKAYDNAKMALGDKWNTNPWVGSKITLYSNTEKEELLSNMNSELTSLQRVGSSNAFGKPLTDYMTLNNLDSYLAIKNDLSACRIVPTRWYRGKELNSNLEKEKNLVNKLKNASDIYTEARSRLLERFDDEFLTIDGKDMLDAVKMATSALAFEYSDSDTDNLFERKETIRENLLGMIEIIKEFKVTLSDLRTTYGFDNNIPVTQYGNYIKALRMLLSKYPFTEYYFGNGAKDVEDVAGYTQKMMEDVESRKYEIKKNYLNSIFENVSLEQYRSRLLAAVSAVASIRNDKMSERESIRRTIDSARMFENERSVMANDASYRKLLANYGISDQFSVAEAIKRIHAIDMLLSRNGTNSLKDLDKKIELLKDAIFHKEELDTLKGQIRDEFKNLGLDAHTFENMEKFDLLCTNFDNPDVIFKTTKSGLLEGFINRFEDVREQENNHKQAIAEARTNAGIKESVSEDEIKGLADVLLTIKPLQIWNKEEEKIRELIKSQRMLATTLVELREELVNRLGDAVFFIDASAMLNRFRNDHTGPFKSFSKRYKEDCKTIKNAIKTGGGLTDSEIIKILEDVSSYQNLLHTYYSKLDTVRNYLGILSYNPEHDWDAEEKRMDDFDAVKSLLESPENAVLLIEEGKLGGLVQLIADTSINETWQNVDQNGQMLLGSLYKGKNTDIQRIKKQHADAVALLNVYKNEAILISVFALPDRWARLEKIKVASTKKTEIEMWFAEKTSQFSDLLSINNPSVFSNYKEAMEDLNALLDIRTTLGSDADAIVERMSAIDKNALKNSWSAIVDLAHRYDLSDESIVADFLYKSRDVSVYEGTLAIYEQLDLLRYRPIDNQKIEDIICDIESVIAINKETAQVAKFESRNKLMLGETYHGLETDWALINEMISSAKSIIEAFGGKVERKFLRIILDKEIHHKEDFVKNLERKYAELEHLMEGMSNIAAVPMNELIDVFEDEIYAIDIIRYCHERVDKFCTNDLSYSSLVDSLSTLSLLQQNEKEMRQVAEECSGLMPEFNFEDPISISSALNTIECNRALRKSVVANNIDRKFIEWAAESRENTQVTLDALKTLESYKDKYLDFTTLFADGEKLKMLTLTELKERIDNGIKYFGMVGQTIDLKECEKKCVESGLGEFVKSVKNKDEYVGKLDRVFTKAFYYAWLAAQADNIDVLKNFRAAVQNENVKQYAKLDNSRLSISVTRINEKLIEKMPTRDSGVGKGEISVLINEMNKKQGQMPLRRLFGKIPKLLLQLKPCLMMSPLSVSYFLESSAYKFDMVIFDEASQIFPQDAIGAISRGKQVIIVGDTKQLPPTNFFNTKAITGEDIQSDEDDDDVSVVSDSILEEANNHLVSRSLLWHYRSKNEGLISFSNREIYNGNLVTFPSSSVSVPGFGVEYVYVSNGRYQNQVNDEEASRCVQLVKEHIERYPDRSLGIIAFSEKQQTLIEEKIRRWRIRNKQYEFFFSENREDPFFVKNLENVQGDERDTIIFSICYAKDPRGTLYYRFGPLGASGGERRLNVAVTRAKYNIKLVGSLLPDEIDLERTSSEGVKQLRKYIDYAMNGVSVLDDKKQFVSDDNDGFINSIAAFIRSQGYDVKVNVGDSDYKVNIGVVDPENKNRYIAGIECDGEIYRTARTSSDRDNLRPRVLKNMGWNMYHVWSVEWNRNPAAEKKNLLNHIRSAERRARTNEQNA